MVTGALLLSPLMLSSVARTLPDLSAALPDTVTASARLVSGLYAYRSEAPAETLADVSESISDDVMQYSYLTLDDSFMLSVGDPGMPWSENEDVFAEETDTPTDYPEDTGSRDGIIESVTYGFMQGEQYVNLSGGGQVRNMTDISNDTLLAASDDFTGFDITSDGSPQVLIMHTHETESYEKESTGYYDSSFTCRTTDDSMNMAAVGDEIAAQLENAGIGVIHDTTKHDYPSYNGSYDRSRETVQSILEEYPTIKVVLDIHRDAIERADGTRVSAVAEIDGRTAAQAMIICCCDDGSGALPNYMENFTFACALQSQLESDYSGLTRPVLFDYRHYNQDLTTGSLLIEVGSHGNSIDEAKYTGELIGKALAELLL
jgi:stage II sporulation protein P